MKKRRGFPPIKREVIPAGIAVAMQALGGSSRIRFYTEVKFRAMVDLQDGRGFQPLSDLATEITVCELAAELAITDGNIPDNAKVEVHAYYLGGNCEGEYQTHRVVKRPKGKKWKEYCDTHYLCGHCGHVVERVKHADSCGEQPGGDSGRHDQQHAG